MKGKIMIMALAVALLVGVYAPSSARANDVQEWSNFGEYWMAQGNAIEDLPFEYNANYHYLYLRSKSSYHYIFVWDISNESDLGVYWSEGNYDRFYFDETKFYALYENFDNTGWNNRTDAYSDYITSNFSCEGAIYYTDIDICDYYGNVLKHKTKTGESVSFQFALADLSNELKETLQSYQYYVVAKVPYRVNDYMSEQIMIAVSNGNRVILRDEAYNQIFFTTGSGYEAGRSYIYCSECCTWSNVIDYKAYIVGDTVASGGATPEVLWSNCDIYYEDGTSYGLTDELWLEACPYSEDDMLEDENQEVVTDGFPRLFEVTKSVGFIHAYPDSDSAILCALVNGKGGLAFDVEYDNSGDAWYKVGVSTNLPDFENGMAEGYILADSVKVTFSAPSIGGSSGGEVVTPNPTVPPSAGSDVEVPKFDIDWNNIKLDDIPEVVGQIKDAVLGFFDIVGVVPLMIGAVFGFLPSWCLWMFGLSFALLGVLLVIKLIRG